MLEGFYFHHDYSEKCEMQPKSSQVSRKQGQVLWLSQGQPRALQEAMDVVYGPVVPCGVATSHSPLLSGAHLGLLLSCLLR